jgi:hypothetical protein
MIVFGIIMLTQVIGMLIHRTGTLLHIMSTTSLDCFSSDDDEDSFKVKEEFVKLALAMGRLDIREEVPAAPRSSVGDDDNENRSLPNDSCSPLSDTLAALHQVPHVSGGRRRRHRSKKQPVNGAAPSRSVPTVHEAFSLQVEKLRQMTEADIDNYTKVKTVVLSMAC